MPEPLEVDLAGANVALDAAGGMPDTIPSTGPDPFNRDNLGQFASKAPEAPTPVEDAPTDVTPATPEAGTEDEVPSFTNIPDDALTPEQLQMKRSLQADYTRKTQKLAEEKKLYEGFDLEAEQLKEAAEVYKRLQDPRNWPTIHSELTEFMQQYGMSPAQARQAATDQIANMAPDTEPEPLADFGYDDEGVDLSPVMAQMKAQQQQIQQLTQLVTADQQKRQAELQYQTLAEGLTRMETTIRQQNPHYTDDDVESIYQMVGSDGNLFSAQQKYESIIGNRLAQYIASKTGALQGAPTPIAGGGVIPSDEVSEDVKRDPEAMHRAAMAHVAALEREEATT